MAKKLQQVAMTEKFKALSAEARHTGEDNDCAVKALALACGVSYAHAHTTLSDLGRKRGKGTMTNIIAEAVLALGCEIRVWLTSEHRAMINAYPGVHKGLKGITTHHPARFKAAWEKATSQKRMMLFTKRHVSALVDGQFHDWAINNAKPVQTIWEITKR